MTPLQEVLGRVEGVEGPDRELDAALWLAMTPGATRRIIRVKHAHSDAEWDIHETRDATGGRLVSVPAYTASLDAALGLVERVLPGAEYELTTIYGVARATLPLNCSDTVYPETGERKDGNMPLAICAALLKALIAQEGEGRSQGSDDHLSAARSPARLGSQHGGAE